MTDVVVCSFWVHRPEDYPDACNYPAMLRILDASCERVGLDHVVLTDSESERHLRSIERDDGVEPLSCFASDLPRNLLQATTAAQAHWMRSQLSSGVDTVFVGADCLVLRDFRSYLSPDADLEIVYLNHKRLWIMNGFIRVPARSRDKLAPLFAEVARGTRALEAETCDDMQSWERVLAPAPVRRYGIVTRRGLKVRFLEERLWNGRPKTETDRFDDSFVLHFRGHHQKAVFFDWADAHGFGVDA